MQNQEVQEDIRMKGKIIIISLVSIICLTSLVSSWSSSLNDDLLGYWRFNQTAGTNVPEAVSSLANGTATNMEDGDWVSGINDNSLIFDGTNEYVKVDRSQDLSAFDIGTGDFSISLWVNSTNLSGDLRIISKRWWPYSGFEIGKNGNDRLSVTIEDTGSDTVTSTDDGNTIPNGKWSHLVVVFNKSGNVLTRYINGTQTGTQDDITSIGDTTSNASIGFGCRKTDGEFSGPDLLWEGRLDEIAFFNKSLSPSEVSSLYNSGTGDFYSTIQITVGSPANAYSGLVNENITFNASITSSNPIQNASLYIDGVFNKSKSYTGTTNTSTFYLSFPEGDYTWYIRACDNSNICKQSSSRTLSIDFIKIDSETYSSSSIETTNETFVINITYSSSSWNSISAKLNYDGTNYSGTQAGVGDAVGFSRTIDIPVVSATSNKTFYWLFTLTNSTGSFIYTSSQHNQTVVPISFFSCNSSQTPYINFSTYSASSPYSPINATFKSSWDIRTIGGSGALFNYSIQDTSENNRSWAFCFSDTGKSYVVTADIEIDGIKSAKNFHYLYNLTLTNVTTNISLYLLNDSLATLTVLEVRDKSSQASMENVYISIQYYDIGTDTFRTVSMGKSNQDGEDLSYLNWYDSLYRFVFVRGGVTLYSTNPFKIAETPQIFDIPTTTTFEFEKFDDFSYSLYYNSTTQNFVLIFVKPSGDVDLGCLRVIKRNQTDDYLICDSCETSSSATVYCNIASYGNGTFIASFYAIGSIAEYISTISEVIGGSQIYEAIGNLDGTVLAIIFAGIIMTLFLVSPVLGILGLILGLLGTYVLGFQPMEYYTFLGIVVVGGLLMWLIKR